MKILFICGCLEPGKDGVGDYILLLSKELILKGIEPVIIALNDPYVFDEKEDLREFASYRLPSGTAWSSKVNKTKEWIDKNQPDHIIWQFVIYAYHPRGLAYWPLYLLKKLLKNYSHISIMFHEIWIGAAKEDSIIEKCIGEIQRLIILDLVRELRPSFVFTSNQTYCRLLEKQGVRTNLLPLFSNIPFLPGADKSLLECLRQKQQQIPDRSLKFGLFGRIPFNWNKQNFIEQVQKIMKELPVVLLVAGRSDQMTAKELQKELKTDLPSLIFIELGEQPVSVISGFLQYVHFGITTNTLQTLGKSGVFAAYREHGVPAVNVGIKKEYFNDCTATDEAVNHLILEMDDNFSKNFKIVQNQVPKNTREEVTTKFLNILTANVNTASNLLPIKIYES